MQNCTSQCTVTSTGPDSGAPPAGDGGLSANCMKYITCCEEDAATDGGTASPDVASGCTSGRRR